MANKIEYKDILKLDNICKHNFAVMCIDPSGTMKNGFGTTGIVLFCCSCCKVIKHYAIQLTKDFNPLDLVNSIKVFLQRWPTTKVVVIENYISYGQGIGVESETKYVVDAIKYHCLKKKIECHTPNASQHKARFNNEILQKHGVDLKFWSNHEKDALRMALYYYMFKFKKEYV